MSHWPAAFSPKRGSSSGPLLVFSPLLSPKRRLTTHSEISSLHPSPLPLKTSHMSLELTSPFISLQYDKEINVINTATAECSVPSKRRVDLPVTAGEQLDVIDITEGSAVICRNSEGRCKFAESLWHGWSLFNPVLRGKQQYVLCASPLWLYLLRNLLIHFFFSPFSQMGTF